MKILVIGAGVAGLLFSSFMDGADVTVLDKNEFAGRKLLATGNGRCNFTNLNQGKKYYYSSNPLFSNHSLESFDQNDLIDYFHRLGLATTNLPSGRCYPLTMSSKTVRDMVYMKAANNAKFLFNEEVIGIDFKKKLVKTPGKKIAYDKLVIASGGITLANSGSDGSIFDLIKNEIPVTEMTYGITNFKTKQKLSKKAKGTKITGEVNLFVDGKLVNSSVDDIIFQDYGITGTAVLDISNDLSLALKNNKEAYVEIDFLPNFQTDDYINFIGQSIKDFPERTVREVLLGIINEKLIDDLLKISKMDGNLRASDVSPKEAVPLIKNLRRLRFDIVGINDTENAQVTLGGVDTKYIDNKTLASTIYPDVHFIGEVLDVAGACGGYNIQWAASSAFACAEYLRSLNV